MANNKPWLKMWTSWLGDIQMDRLSLAEQGAYWRLFSLCHDCGHVDKDGKLTGALISAGAPLTLVEIIKSLKISDDLDKAIFMSMFEKMKVAGYLDHNGYTIYVTNYEESQRAATDTKADRSRRQRERRERLAEDDKRKVSPTPSLKENNNIYIRGETGHGKHHGISVTQSQTQELSSHVKSVTNGISVTVNKSSETLKEIMRCHDEYIGGLINSVKSAKITDFSEFFDNNGGKIEWIEKGFAAAPASKRQWDYIQAILQRYLDNGGPDDREKTNQSSRRSGPQQRTRQPRRHPITYIKGSDPADG